MDGRMAGLIFLIIGVVLILVAFKLLRKKPSKESPTVHPPGPEPKPEDDEEPENPEQRPVVLLHYEPERHRKYRNAWVCPHCETENSEASLRCRICDEPR